MKIVTVLGTRPEIIRLSLIIRKLDQFAETHTLVHTGQNYLYRLNKIFFQEMGVRAPDYFLGESEMSLGEQLGTMFSKLEKILKEEKPDKMLVLGDTNSALSAILAERMNIPVYHMESGNRCYDLNVPEEKNRRVIDAVSTFNLPYTPQSKQHLEQEGFPSERTMLSGNPIYEVLQHYQNKIEQSDILEQLNLKHGGYFLTTIHRAENVDNEAHLLEILAGLNKVAKTFNQRIICSLHPRTKSKINNGRFEDQVQMHEKVEFHEPFGFFDFVQLEKHAACVLTDSGTVQEECCLFHVPTVTVRQTTERPETVACGSNTVSGLDADRIKDAVNVMMAQSRHWQCPEGYLDQDVSDRVVKFLLGGIRIV